MGGVIHFFQKHLPTVENSQYENKKEIKIVLNSFGII